MLGKKPLMKMKEVVGKTLNSDVGRHMRCRYCYIWQGQTYLRSELNNEISLFTVEWYDVERKMTTQDRQITN